MTSRWLPYVALAGVDAVLAQRGLRKWRRFTKPLLMPVLAATTLGATTLAATTLGGTARDTTTPGTTTLGHTTPGAGERDTAVRRAAAVALAGATVGDVALLGRSERAFLGGIGGFLVAHGGWLVACAKVPGDGRALRRPWPFVVVYALAAGVLAPRVERRLRGPVLAYAAVLNAMGAVAVDTAARLPRRRGRAVMAGAGLFLLSDAVLAANRFVRPLPGAEATVMVTYTAGQALLAAGLLGHEPTGVE